MRVHPSLLKNRNRRWQLPGAMALLIFLLIVNVARGPKETVRAANQGPIERKIRVLVAERGIEAGQPLEKAVLRTEERPINLLPPDVITTQDQLRNKVAAGPIPAGYPLARALLADPVPILPAAATEAEVEEINPIDTLLEEIKKDTVAVPVTFSAESPPRGSRVAVAVSGAEGQTVLLLDKAWISESTGNRATLRVDPQLALLVQSARKLGNFSFIEIPVEGESPYAGHAVADLETLEVALGLRNPTSKAPLPVKKDDKQFKGYAWVSGGKVKYGIGTDGSMQMVDAQGRSMNKRVPLGGIDPNYDPEREEVP